MSKSPPSTTTTTTTTTSHSSGVYVISDLHSDFRQNVERISRFEDRRCRHYNHNNTTDESVLIVAGDVSDHMNVLIDTLQQLQQKYDVVAFCPGNHELWLRENDSGFATSFDKIEAILAACRDIGVRVDPFFTSSSVLIVPLVTFYDDSLALEGSVYDTETMGMWTDTHMCKWKANTKTQEGDIVSTLRFVTRTCKERYILPAVSKALEMKQQQQKQRQQEHDVCCKIISFSHFYTHQLELKPLYEKVAKTNDERLALIQEMHCLKKPNFSLVAGTTDLHDAICQLDSDIHVVGHSHRPFEMKIPKSSSAVDSDD
eukprot:PhM_4_TR15625/c0_g1_i7/m.66395